MLVSYVIGCFLINLYTTSAFNDHKRTARSLENCSKDYKYTTVSWTTEGRRPCMTDCEAGYCMTSWTACEACSPLKDRLNIAAPTYYTSQYKQSSYSKCLSKCGNFGEKYTWCVVDNDRKWDYCNAETIKPAIEVQLSSRLGPCRTECEKYGSRYLWCWTWRSDVDMEEIEAWDYCEQKKVLIHQVRTIYGKECRGECKKSGERKYYSCIDSSRDTKLCAPPADYDIIN